MAFYTVAQLTLRASNVSVSVIMNRAVTNPCTEVVFDHVDCLAENWPDGRLAGLDDSTSPP